MCELRAKIQCKGGDAVRYVCARERGGVRYVRLRLPVEAGQFGCRTRFVSWFVYRTRVVVYIHGWVEFVLALRETGEMPRSRIIRHRNHRCKRKGICSKCMIHPGTSAVASLVVYTSTKDRSVRKVPIVSCDSPQ